MSAMSENCSISQSYAKLTAHLGSSATTVARDDCAVTLAIRRWTTMRMRFVVFISNRGEGTLCQRGDELCEEAKDASWSHMWNAPEDMGSEGARFKNSQGWNASVW